MDGPGLRRTVALTILLSLSAALSLAQVRAGSSLTGPQPQTESEQTRTQQVQPKNLLTMDELTALDSKFHKEMDVAQDAFDREKFADAETAFSQLAQDTEDAIKRISVSTLAKNTFIEVDGVKKPATIQAETEWFARTLNKAQQKKNVAGILRGVTDMQKQAADLLSAGKYPEDRDAYRKSADLLAANRSQIETVSFSFSRPVPKTDDGKASRHIGRNSSPFCGTVTTGPLTTPKCRRKRFVEQFSPWPTRL
jgi:hypothetical protein